MQAIIADSLNRIRNSKKVGKKTCIVIKSNLLIAVLNIMKKNKYISGYKIEKNKFEYINVEIGNLHECRAITPRFYVRKNEFNKYIRRYLPARDFGIIIVSTNKGLMTHTGAIEQNLGGSLIAYCY